MHYEAINYSYLDLVSSYYKMYNFDSPLWQNSKAPQNSNRKLKSISIQKSMN